ncbi:MAG TPA: hypothetical protein DIT05_01370 [Morganella sp. (in: Bacteria)]|nr:hypothetical protein [Morganella sp. (in: enterobacteria)]
MFEIHMEIKILNKQGMSNWKPRISCNMVKRYLRAGIVIYMLHILHYTYYIQCIHHPFHRMHYIL